MSNDPLSRTDEAVEHTDATETRASVRPTAWDEPTFSRRQFVTWGLGIELATLAVAIGLAFLSGQHFWQGINWNVADIAIGCLAALPMMVVFSTAGDLRELVRRLLGPALAEASKAELFFIAVLAGVCEEALFRGVLEPWWSGPHWIVGFLTANLVFGLLHAVTRNYLILATAFGMYLSLLTWTIAPPNLLRAIVCHAVYDFVAFLWLARLQRRQTPGNSE
jgi:hypothetical protein